MLKKLEIYKNKLVLFFIFFLALLVVSIYLQSQNNVNDYSLEIVSPSETIVQPLSKDQVIQIAGFIGIVRVQVLAHKVYVVNSTCPDKICVKAGSINKPGPMIVCAPNKVVIRIISQRIKPLVSY